MFSKAIFKYAALAAMRDRLLWAMLILMGLVVTLSLFSAGAAVTEQNQFTLVFMGSGLRLLGVFGLITFVSFQMRRFYDHKEIDYLLAAPITRTGFLLSVSAAYMMMALLFGGFVLAVFWLISGGLTYGNTLWGVSIIAEWVIVVAMTLFFSSIVKSATVSVLSSLSFYVLARMIGVFTGIASSPFGETTLQMKAAGKVLSAISMFVPRFDLMGQSSWLLYEGSFNIGFGFIGLQVFIFVALFLSATAFDMQRNEF